MVSKAQGAADGLLAHGTHNLLLLMCCSRNYISDVHAHIMAGLLI